MLSLLDQPKSNWLFVCLDAGATLHSDQGGLDLFPSPANFWRSESHFL